MENNRVSSLQYDQELIHTPIHLNQHVELLTGANDEPMLFNQENGRYIRLSVFSLEVLHLMDGTLTAKDIAVKLQNQYSIEFPDSIYNFFSTLRQADVLNLKPLPEKSIKKMFKKVSDKPMLRLPLVRSLDKVTIFLLTLYNYVPTKLRKSFWLALIIGILTLYSTFFLVELSFQWTKISWILVILIIISNLVLHELAHAVVTKNYGISIREAGIALLYYFVPVAYVDRTDTYRLKSKKSRIQIALAGPCTDLLLGAGWACVAILTTQEMISQTAQIVALLQLLFAFNNFNLLMPTDGYHAVEAAVGELSLRRRALSYFFSVITFRSAPKNMKTISKNRKKIYFAYSLVSITYFVFLLAGVGVYFVLLNEFMLKG